MNEKINPEFKKPRSTNSELVKEFGSKALILLGLGLVVGAGINHFNGGSELTTKEKFNPDIEKVTVTEMTIDEGAILRNDPVVENGENNNIVKKTNHTVKFDKNGNMLIYIYDNDGANGKWFGISAKDIKKADPNFDSNGYIDTDKDGTIWVNEQKASVEIDPQITNYYADRQIQRPNSDSTTK